MSLIENAKKLRCDQTDAEQRLWYHLRAHRFLGLKFKRQKPIGGYIVDFVCHEHQLIIEVDGGQHQENAESDRRRDASLHLQGYRVLRFWNHDVLQRTEAVLEAIHLAVQPISSINPNEPDSPPPLGGGVRGEGVVEQRTPSPPTPLPQAGEGSE
ncbi:MAG: endonuclease domain-containing protein [Gammaproteobacteria bacterium]|nr:endonuclease domain-containing protein [Gammaproteobacteria bacterium]